MRGRWGRTAALLAAGLVLAGCASAPAHVSTARHPRQPSATPTPTPSPSPAPVVVTIGDSIMAGLGLPSGQNWPTMLGARDHVALVDLGCPSGGFVAVGLCGQDYAGLIPQAVAAKPELVIIQSSSNDRGRTDAQVAAATTATLAQLRSALPSARIVGLSTLWGATEWRPAEIDTSSAALRGAVEAVGGSFVDVGQPLRGHPEWMQPDAIHPTLDGQTALADAIGAALQGAGVDLTSNG